MTTWFVSRHPGALDWIKSKGLPVDKWIKHLDTSLIEPGDTVIVVTTVTGLNDLDDILDKRRARA